MEDETLKALKDLTAHNFIPKALVVGTLGNLINFVILSRYIWAFVFQFHFELTLGVSFRTIRTCIRSSANIYLSILAFADIFFMLLIYVSSKQYHDDVHHQTYEIYWRMFGLSHWFYTAFCKYCLHVFHLTLKPDIILISFSSRSSLFALSVHHSFCYFELGLGSKCCCEPSHKGKMRHRSGKECRFE